MWAYVLQWLVVGLVFGMATLAIALRKRRNALGWGAAVLLVPLLVVVLILLPPRPLSECDYCRLADEKDRQGGG